MNDKIVFSNSVKTDEFFSCLIIGLVLVALSHVLMFIFHSFVVFVLVMSAGLTLLVIDFDYEEFNNAKKDEDGKD